MTLLASQHLSSTGARLILVAELILLLRAGTVTATAASLTFAGVAFSPGSTVKANVPLSTQEKSLASQGGNAVPPNAVAMLATPSNFDPGKVGRYWLCAPPAISNDRIAMTLSTSITELDLLKVGCCLPATDHSLLGTTPARGVAR